MLPPLNALRTFEAVARHMSFTAAAHDLNVTTSAVSHQIRSLEEFFGTLLIERNGQKLSLTIEGEILRENLSTAFDLLKKATSNVQALCKANPVGISMTPYFAAKWLAPRLSRFWQIHPGFDLRFYHTSDPESSIDRSVHVSIQWLKKRCAPEDGKLLVDGKLIPACSPDLLQNPVKLKAPSDLVHHSLLHGDDRAVWADWLTLADVPDLVPKYYEYYEDANVRHQAAIQGEGFAIVCPTLSADEIGEGRLVCPFDVTLDTFAYYIVVPRGRDQNANVRKLVNWMMTESEQSQDG